MHMLLTPYRPMHINAITLSLAARRPLTAPHRGLPIAGLDPPSQDVRKSLLKGDRHRLAQIELNHD